ncbi:MAG: malto-oligosyltrehalose synthase [Nitrospira sp.]|jgi:(1->4)-alpha-D-glucan 1-alpha-D-glucosylmutase|nr:malto-oligosyltrehalose synthase [Nitrospira sp.]MDI3463895.1 Malto-oligosyltrehalose synthase [Nitrospira sp.]
MSGKHVLATYRLQLNPDFGFRRAREVAAYLHDLGITHCYSSSILAAMPGSTHGYDVIDPSRVNPELGTEEEFQSWCRSLHDRGMGLILDVVPNHMGIADALNRWWYDVLENGSSSRYAAAFDIDWRPLKRELHNKVLLPILSDHYGVVLENQDIAVAYEEDRFVVRYGACRLPLAPKSWSTVLSYGLDALLSEGMAQADSEGLTELQSILTAIRHLPDREDSAPDEREEGEREKEVIRKRIAMLMAHHQRIAAFVQNNLRLFNGTAGEPCSFNLLDELLNQQAYRLASWKVASEEINYRRFFDINELAAIRVEEGSVFDATHEVIFKLLRDGTATGVRIDHVDGLYDPGGYLQHLQSWARRELIGGSSAERPLFVVVEKILGLDEPLPQSWPIEGTTGYEFLNTVNGLFVDHTRERAFSDLYRRITKRSQLYADMVYEAKQLIMRASMASEINVLGHQLNLLSEKDRRSRDFTLNSLTNAIREIIACFPVYRTYVTVGTEPVSERDKSFIHRAVAQAKRRNPTIGGEVFDFIRGLLLKECRPECDKAHEYERFVMKFQQTTSPVTAKGIEDTVFYRYNRLLSLNEVGGEPQRFGIAPEVFHRRMVDRQARWPKGLSATATHDTKRGEDVRARLNVLSEIPDEWKTRVTRWMKLNAKHRVKQESEEIPEANDEYLLYQTLLGAWPLADLRPDERSDFCTRMQQYMEKAIHEAKVHTSWVNPNREYDDGVRRFVQAILDDGRANKFLDDFLPFKERIAGAGVVNSLAQTILKVTAPGTPDFYQGSELWDWNLVDPDNRRPVDYARRQTLVRELKDVLERPDRFDAVQDLVRHSADGRIKLYLILAGLHCRRMHADVFEQGRYVPLEAEGPEAKHLLTFARLHGTHTVMVAVPRLVALRSTEAKGSIWDETWVMMPAEWKVSQLQDILTGRSIVPDCKGERDRVRASELFAACPVGVLVGS